MDKPSPAEMGTWASLGDWLWFVAFGVASSLWCLSAAGQLGATFDEPVYLNVGMETWRTGSNHGLMRLGTMPLPVDLVTLPLYTWEQWRGRPFDPVADFDVLLPYARAMTLLFWWLLLCYARLTGRSLAGPWGGRLAVALIACEPSFLAHAGLATTDISITACLLALVYHFRTGREAGWFRRVALPTIWFALALLAKASALVYGPLCLLAVEVERLVRAGALPGAGSGWRNRCRQSLAALLPWMRDMRWIGIGGLAGMLFYCGCDWRAEPSFVKWANRLPEGPTASVMVWLADHLCIFTNGFEGLVQQVKHNVRGHGAYLLGQRDARALWFYFPALLSIKLSTPVLIAPFVVALFRPRALLNWAFLCAAFLVLISPAFRVQLGIRLLLPVVALGLVGLAAALVELCRDVPAIWQRRVLTSGIGAGVAWTACAAVVVWPNGLCYINELWGGMDRGYRLVSESNYDWGQGLNELERWRCEQGLEQLDVWYFGADPTFERRGMRVVPLHVTAIEDAADVSSQLHGRYLAVSASLLYGLDRGSNTAAFHQSASYLRALKPVARTTTFFIYEFPQR
ncbi:MAG: hypothetical protein K2R98_04990 [Gemmataceae bacterium]|nr:hypothetical protein [Gemmataceae bacterium]